MKLLTKKQIVSLIMFTIVLAVTLPYLFSERPSRKWLNEYKSSPCVERQVASHGVKIWVMDCEFAIGNLYITPTDTPYSFEQKIAGINRNLDHLVIEIFRKDKDAPIDTLMPEFIKKGTPKTDCVFQKMETKRNGLIDVYEIMPIGKRQMMREEQAKNNELPEPQCGPYGHDDDSERYF